MKKTLLAFLLFYAVNASAQMNDSSSREQYCEMLCSQKLLSSKVNISMDFGEKINYWRDRRMKDSLGNVVNFNSVIDAMNYMGKKGWVLQSSLLLGGSGSYVYHYIFKKTFLYSEMEL